MKSHNHNTLINALIYISTTDNTGNKIKRNTLNSPEINITQAQSSTIPSLLCLVTCVTIT